MSTLLSPILTPLIILAALMLKIVPRLRLWYIARRTEAELDQATRMDISEQGVYIPDSIRDQLAYLERLGFQRTGEVEGFHPRGGTSRQWVLADEAATTVALVHSGETGPETMMRTCFENGAWLTTTVRKKRAFNRPIRLPDYWMEPVPKSDPETLYDTHRQRIDDFGKLNGAPRPVRNMADFMEQAAIFSERHRPRLHRAFTLTIQALLLGPLAAAVLLAGLPCLTILWANQLFWTGAEFVRIAATIMVASVAIAIVPDFFVLRIPIRKL